MADVVYRFTEKVEAALVDEKARLLRFRELHLISSDQVREMYQSFLERHLSAARLEDHPDRAIGVKCPECERVHVMPGSVRYFQCKCSPFVDRMTAIHRTPLI